MTKSVLPCQWRNSNTFLEGIGSFALCKLYVTLFSNSSWSNGLGSSKLPWKNTLYYRFFLSKWQIFKVRGRGGLPLQLRPCKPSILLIALEGGAAIEADRAVIALNYIWLLWLICLIWMADFYWSRKMVAVVDKMVAVVDKMVAVVDKMVVAVVLLVILIVAMYYWLWLLVVVIFKGGAFLVAVWKYKVFYGETFIRLVNHAAQLM